MCPWKNVSMGGDLFFRAPVAAPEIWPSHAQLIYPSPSRPCQSHSQPIPRYLAALLPSAFSPSLTSWMPFIPLRSKHFPWHFGVCSGHTTYVSRDVDVEKWRGFWRCGGWKEWQRRWRFPVRGWWWTWLVAEENGSGMGMHYNIDIIWIDVLHSFAMYCNDNMQHWGCHHSHTYVNIQTFMRTKHLGVFQPYSCEGQNMCNQSTFHKRKSMCRTFQCTFQPMSPLSSSSSLPGNQAGPALANFATDVTQMTQVPDWEVYILDVHRSSSDRPGPLQINLASSSGQRQMNDCFDIVDSTE